MKQTENLEKIITKMQNMKSTYIWYVGDMHLFFYVFSVMRQSDEALGTLVAARQKLRNGGKQVIRFTNENLHAGVSHLTDITISLNKPFLLRFLGIQ